ncbi:hypothetical protein BEQ56_01810 [Anaerolineaceae bacterium oral taxon 439]|nr:hypothetical protein BEQ56_01810 [Anaerolineaceae bacterium oral taxon 439]
MFLQRPDSHVKHTHLNIVGEQAKRFVYPRGKTAPGSAADRFFPQYRSRVILSGPYAAMDPRDLL